MNDETNPPSSIANPTVPTLHFAMRFSSTPRGSRLARRLAGQRLDAWGIPYDCDAHHSLTLIVAELAANAVRHGRVPGRDFHLAVTVGVTSDATTVRIEVTDTRAERVPVLGAATDVRDTGRGLLLVEHLADRWDWHPRRDGPGKTVWAEYVLPTGGCPTGEDDEVPAHCAAGGDLRPLRAPGGARPWPSSATRTGAGRQGKGVADVRSS